MDADLRDITEYGADREMGQLPRPPVVGGTEWGWADHRREEELVPHGRVGQLREGVG